MGSQVLFRPSVFYRAIKLLLMIAIVTALLLPGVERAQAVPSFPPEVSSPINVGGSSLLRFEHLTQAEGLSHSVVTAILQDHVGFLWFATQDGVNKYDGYTFTIYRQAEGLSSNVVWSLYEDHAGRLWAGTSRGLDLYDRKTGRFQRYWPQTGAAEPSSANPAGPVVRAIMEDYSGALWLGTVQAGLIKLEPGREGSEDSLNIPATVYHFRAPGQGNGIAPIPLEIYALIEDEQGAIWLGTQNGLMRLERSPSGEMINLIDLTQASNAPVGVKINVLMKEEARDGKEGALWIGTEGKGLFRFDTTSHHFEQFRPEIINSGSLGGQMVRALLKVSGSPATVATMSNGIERNQLWVGTERGLDWLTIGHPVKSSSPKQETTYRAVHFIHNSLDAFSLSEGAVNVLLEDRSGGLWAGMLGSGLNHVDPAANKFRLYRHIPGAKDSLSEDIITDVLVVDKNIGEESAERLPFAPTGDLWVGTNNGGLNRLGLGEPPGSGQPGVREAISLVEYRHNPVIPSSLSSDTITALYQSRSGQIWVGTDLGLDAWDMQNGGFFHYRHDPEDARSLPSGPVMAIAEDEQGQLWVGTDGGGLARMEPDGFIRFQHDTQDENSLSDNRVSVILPEGDRLWVGTLGGGLNLYQGDRFVHFIHDPADPTSLGDNTIFSLYMSAQGELWVGTWEGGLNLFDPNALKFKHYAEEEGLPDSTIYGILEDEKANLWLSTDRGLAQFDPVIEQSTNYNYQDGLQGNEFMAGAAARSTTGEMYFGGVNGLNAFIPSDVQQLSYVPPVVITSFSKFNHPQRSDLANGERIDLAYDDNFISFDFASLDFNAPERNQYAYRMEGIDAEWVNAGNRRHVDYPNLPAGNYIFRVRGSSSDGIWNEQGAWLVVTIRPPIWGTKGFQLGMILAVVSIAGGIYWLRVRGLESRSRELEAQVARRTQELSTLLETSQSVLSTISLEPLLDLILDRLNTVVMYTSAAVMLCDEQFGEMVLRTVAYRGPLPQDEVLQQVLPLRQAQEESSQVTAVNLYQQVILQKEPVVLHKDGRRQEQNLPEGQTIQTQSDEIPGLSPAFSFPTESQSWMGIPLIVKGNVIGLLSVGHDQPDFYTPQTAQLALAFAYQVAQALENARLYKQGQNLAAVEERQRLARDLHDAVTQTLFSANLIADVLPDLWERDPGEGKQMVRDLRQLNKGALAEMRTLLMELRPAALAQAMLPDLLRQLIQAARGRTAIPVELTIAGVEQLYRHLPGPVLEAFYRVAQEALNNIIHHSRASQAAVDLCSGWNPGEVAITKVSGMDVSDVAHAYWVELRVEDNGIGFPFVVGENLDGAIPGSEHFGLNIMQERADAIGATLEIQSRQAESVPDLEMQEVKSEDFTGSGTIIRMVWKSDVLEAEQDGGVME